MNRLDSCPPRIPDHELLRLIGSGGYGDVWLARNVMGTYRAVKVVYRSRFIDDRSYGREYIGIEKFEPVSRSHESFVDILQVGRNDEEGYYYYVMEIGDDVRSGQKIDPAVYSAKTLSFEKIERGRLSFQQCIQIALSLSDGLTHLHKNGLIHRDIKPANIIFVNGLPKIADIGLVAEAGGSHSVVGTVGYMPDDVGTTQADIYSLGKVLYEISTGLDRKLYPTLPTSLDRMTAPRDFLDLNEVIVRACEADITKRYQTAEEMHADLVLLQTGRSVNRLRTLERRLALLKKAGFAALAGSLVVGTVWFEVSRSRRALADQRRQQARLNVVQGTRFMEEGDFFRALPPFVEALNLDQGNRLLRRSHRVRIASVLRQCQRIVQMWFLGDQVNGASLSQDGRYVVTAGKTGLATLCDITGASAVAKIHTGFKELESVAFSPDGQFIAVAGKGGVEIWETRNQKRVQAFSMPGHTVYGVNFSADQRRLASASAVGSGGAVWLWDWRHGSHKELCADAMGPYGDAVFSPNGSRVIAVHRFSNDSKLATTAQLWDVESLRPVGDSIQHPNWIFRAAFSPDGRRVATASYDGSALVSDAETGRPIFPALKHPAPIRSVAFSPDGRYLLSAGSDFSARIWNMLDGSMAYPILKHSGKYILSTAFTPDGRRVVMVDANGVVIVWDLAASALPAAPAELVFSPDGNRFVSANNPFATLFSAENHTAISHIETESPILDILLSQDGSKFVTINREGRASAPRTAQLFEGTTGRNLGSAFALDPFAWGAVLSRDGRWLATKSRTNAFIWDTARGKLAFSLSHRGLVKGVAFSPNGKWIATISGEPTEESKPEWEKVQWDRWDWVSGTNVMIWSGTSGKLVHDLPQEFPAKCVEFSPDETRLVVCMSDSSLFERAAQVWDVQKGRKIGPPLRHADGVRHAIFSPDGKKVATASEDSTVCLWNAETGELLLQPLWHGGEVADVCFSPDGRWIASACETDMTARVWDAETGEPVTPPMKQPWQFKFVQFVDQGRALVTRQSSGVTMVWPLPEDSHTIDELRTLAKIFGRQSDFAGDHESLQRAWETLKAQNSSALAVSLEDIVAWHTQEAKSSEESGQWKAALFHWEELTRIKPGEPLFEKSRDMARSHLAPN